MPSKTGRLTEHEARYIEARATIGDPTAAAIKAGYKHPVRAGYKLEERRDIVAEVQARELERLNLDLLPKALGRLDKILSDDKVAPQHHIAAAKAVLAHTIGTGPNSDGVGAGGAPSLAQLEQERARLERALDVLTSQARDVTPAPDPGAGGRVDLDKLDDVAARAPLDLDDVGDVFG